MRIWLNTFFLDFSTFKPEFTFRKSTVLKSYSKRNKSCLSSLSINLDNDSYFINNHNSNNLNWTKFQKNEIDRINKDVHNKLFPKDFEIYMGFLKLNCI